MRLLVEAVAALRAQDPVGLPGAQALAEAGVLLRELERLTALSLARLADVHTRELHALDDAPTAGAWVERQQVGVGRDRVALAGKLARLPLVAGHLADGLLPMRSGVLIGQALDKVRRHVDRPDGLIDDQPAEPVLAAVIVDGVLDLVAQARGGYDDRDAELTALTTQLTELAGSPQTAIARLEAAFLVLAAHLEPAHLRAALDRLVGALLPVQLEDRAQRAHEQRGLKLVRNTDGSGWTVLQGQLDLECGELLHTVLTAELTADPDNPTDTAAWAQARQEGRQPGDDLRPEVCGGPRSLDQQRHDALRNGLRRYLDSGITGQRDKTAPHLSVTVPVEALHDEPGALPPVAASGARLPRSLVRTWWCDSAVTRFVMSLGHRVLETSHTERTLKAHERRAKRVETGGRCQGAGCCRGPGTRLVPHHGEPWARCRTTSLSDAVLLCEQTHALLHRGRTIRLKDGRRLGPDGWITEQAA
jgi:hypothetical protein